MRQLAVARTQRSPCVGIELQFRIAAHPLEFGKGRLVHPAFGRSVRQGREQGAGGRIVKMQQIENDIGVENEAEGHIGPDYNRALPNCLAAMSRILLAPMEGLADEILRDVLTRFGGYDWCMCEFIRVSDTVLPNRAFRRVCPEISNGSRTAAGTPVRLQLMGCEPDVLAANAARVAALRPAGIDLNFGCPAPLVNRKRGGAALLDEPELLARIAAAVRAAVPTDLPFTAKMRLGIDDAGRAIECAQALASGGIDELIVHGRTRADFYRPPARYDWIARVREAVAVPVIANGEVWTQEDYARCRTETGCADVMLGRGAIADPLLIRRLRGEVAEEASDEWAAEIAPAVAAFWRAVRAKVTARQAPGRLKQWLGYLKRRWPEAAVLHHEIRPLSHADEVDGRLAAAGLDVAERQVR